MPKTSSRIEKIRIKEAENWKAEFIKLYHENWNIHNIWLSLYEINWYNLDITPLITNIGENLPYIFNIKGFSISHDFKTNIIYLIKMKKWKRY